MKHRNIVFRVDASIEIGTGHLMRCLTLADALREQGAVCRFISRAHDGNLIELTRQRGYETFALAISGDFVVQKEHGQPAHAAWLGADTLADAQQTKALLGAEKTDWLIVDHYGIDVRWEREMAGTCAQIMVIDDLADRNHECAILLDQNLGRHPSDYAGLVPRNCKVLAGVQYAMLRTEFALMRSHSLERRQQPKLNKILVSMGGVDKDNATAAVLDALAECPLSTDCRILVLMGPHAPWLAAVRAKAASMPRETHVLVNAENMAELMARSDISIGAAGSTSWERCALGLPTFMLTLALNQREAAVALSQTGAVETFDLGPGFNTKLIAAFSRLNDDPHRLRQMSESSANVCDGAGVRRVCSALLN